MKLSLSSLAAIAIVGIAASTLPNAAGHLRSIPPPSLVEDNAHSYDKGATAPLTKGTEEVNHNREGRKLPRKKKKSKKKTSSPTGAPTIDPVKAALEKRAVDAESQLDTVNDELVTCTLEKQQAETKQKEVAKKSLEDTTILKEQLAEAKQAAIKSEKAAKKAAEKSQGELKQSRDEAKKAAGKLQAALTQSQDEVTRMKKAADELKAKSEECEQLQAVAAAKLQSIQSNVCGVITQVESERTKAAAVEKEVAQAYDKMDAAMKEMTASCVPEAQDQSPLQILPAEKEAQQYVTKEQLAQKAYASNISNALGNISNAQGPPLPKAQTETYSEAKQVDARQKQEVFDGFDGSRLDQQQYELEEELKLASEKEELSYVAKNAAEEQYVQISRPRQDVISRDQDGLGAQCSAATQKFIELAVAMITGDHKDTVINVIGRDQTFVTDRGQLTDLTGRNQELIDITGKDKVIELEPDDIDLSSLASIVGCGAVKKQALPFVSDKAVFQKDESAIYFAAGIDNTDADGNFDFGVP